MNYWLVKTEPHTYSWQQFISDGFTVWDGVRNYQVRNYLRQMKIGDPVLFYHSGNEKKITGLAQISREAFPDPTTDDNRWLSVKLVPVQTLNKFVTLEQIKNEIQLKDVLLLRQSRLSVIPLNFEQFRIICSLGAINIQQYR